MHRLLVNTSPLLPPQLPVRSVKQSPTAPTVLYSCQPTHLVGAFVARQVPAAAARVQEPLALIVVIFVPTAQHDTLQDTTQTDTQAIR
jgi:hypothetical protein